MITATSADGTTIASDRTGSGPPVVLVAGALTMRDAFAPLAALLAPHFTVYAYDRRGRGDSADTLPYTPVREVEDLAAVIDLAGGSAYVFGHSSGAAIALDAAGAGVGIAKLVAYEPPFIVDDSRTPPPADLAEQIAALVANGDRDAAFECWMVNTVGETPESLSAWRGTPPWQALTEVVHTTIYDATTMAGRMNGRPLDPDGWPNATMPILVVDGEISMPFMHATADAVATILPDARRYTFPNSGHGAPPEQVAPVLIDFFGGTS
ncbi:MAG TPA: alpha/beta hydrolase [Micromonosporaceae bacterium]